MDDKKHHVGSETSVSLLQQIQAGEQQAWERLVQLYSPLVYGRCRSLGLSQSDAEDVMQDVFRQVDRKLSEFQRERIGSFRRWLRIVTRNAAIDFLRRHERQVSAAGGTSMHRSLQEVAEDSDEDADEADASDLVQLMKRALELLQHEFETTTWQAFWKTAVEEQKAVDVARDLEMSPGSVRNARYKVMRRLKAEFGDLLE